MPKPSQTSVCSAFRTGTDRGCASRGGSMASCAVSEASHLGLEKEEVSVSYNNSVSCLLPLSGITNFLIHPR